MYTHCVYTHGSSLIEEPTQPRPQHAPPLAARIDTLWLPSARASLARGPHKVVADASRAKGEVEADGQHVALQAEGELERLVDGRAEGRQADDESESAACGVRSRNEHV